MIKFTSLFLLSLILASSAVMTLGADCPDYPDIVGPLPNYTQTVAQSCSYAGFAPMDSENTSALFYWYFPNEQGLENAPLLVWLQGGPGASSLWGAFAEKIGPFYIVDNGDGGYNVEHRDGSWASAFNMLFIDNPLGTGYSYSANGNYSTNIDETSQNLWVAIQYFMSVHTETQDYDWYISGESFGGRFVPGLTYWILRNNKDLLHNPLYQYSDQNVVNLKGMILGDGYVHGLGQRVSMIDDAIDLGLVAPYQVPQLKSIGSKCDNTAGQKGVGDNTTVTVCNDIFKFVTDISGIDPLAAQVTSNVTSGLGLQDIPYFNSEDVIKAVNVQGSKKEGPLYTPDAKTSYNALIHQILNSSFVYVNEVLKEVPCLFYYGSLDVRDGSFGAPQWMQLLDSPYNQIVNEQREKWLIGDEIAGYWQIHENMTFLTIDFAGHFVPYFVLDNSVEMLKTFTTTKDWGTEGIGKIMCNQMNQCSEHGTCDQTTGICNCETGYGLEDCSALLTNLTSKDKATLKPREYAFYQVPIKQNDYIITIQNSSHLEVLCSYEQLITQSADAVAILTPLTSGPNTRSLHLSGPIGDYIFITIQNQLFNSSVNYQITIGQADIQANFFSSTWAAVIAYGMLGLSVLSLVVSINWVQNHRKKLERNNLIIDE